MCQLLGRRRRRGGPASCSRLVASVARRQRRSLTRRRRGSRTGRSLHRLRLTVEWILQLDEFTILFKAVFFSLLLQNPPKKKEKQKNKNTSVFSSTTDVVVYSTFRLIPCNIKSYIVYFSFFGSIIWSRPFSFSSLYIPSPSSVVHRWVTRTVS